MNDHELRADLTPAQVAALLPNTSVDSVRRWIRSGTLPARSLPNGRYLVRRSDVDGLLRPVVAHAELEPITVEPGQEALPW